MAATTESIDVQFTTYQGNVGLGSDLQLAVAELRVGAEGSGSDNKEMVIVVDLSYSMLESIPYLQTSLRAFRDLVVGRQPPGVEERSKEEIEADFRKAIDLTVIGFSDRAWLLYKTRPGDEDDAERDWDKMVLTGIRACSGTNLGEALILAYRHIDPKKASWLVTLTDGAPNSGAYLSVYDFIDLSEKCPPLTRCISLGYGTDFNTDILEVLGAFTYIRSKEQIPTVFGSLTNEIQESWALNAIWELDSSVIDPSKITAVIGGPDIGPLYADRLFRYGFTLADEDTLRGFLDNGALRLRYTRISDGKEVINLYTPTFAEGLEVPDEIVTSYYDSAKGRRLSRLNRILGTTAHLRRGAIFSAETKLEKVEKEVNMWTHPVAAAHRAELLALIRDIREAIQSGDRARVSDILKTTDQKSTDIILQASHTDPKRYTRTQIRSIESMEICMASYEDAEDTGYRIAPSPPRAGTLTMAALRSSIGSIPFTLDDISSSEEDNYDDLIEEDVHPLADVEDD